MGNKITEKKKPKKNINESKKPIDDNNRGIIFDFSSPTAFCSCSIKGKFTNFLKNPNEFVKQRRKIFGEALSYFSKKTYAEINNPKDHTHLISNDKLDLVKTILTKLIDKMFPSGVDKETIVDNYTSGDIWQVGYKQGLRFIGIRQNNIFYVLFIDYHHLIEPDKNYNQTDYYNYKYCPMTSKYCEQCTKIARQ